MTDNITALIAEARRTAKHPSEDRDWQNIVLILADALEAEHKRAEEASADLADRNRQNIALFAERDRYRAEAESARKTGERILADALRYRAAIEEATKVLHLDAERELHDIREILTRALNEGAADV